MAAGLGAVLFATALVGVWFMGAALIAGVRISGKAGGPFAFLALATASLCALLVAGFWAAVPRPLFWRTDWIEAAGIGIGLWVDDLSLLFAVLVAGVSWLSLLYSLRYIPYERAEQGMSGSEAAYYGYMLLFTGSMLGMVFAGDLIQLYLFWELTGIASFLLIGLNWRDPQARYGAVKALLITALGGLAMLVGFLLLGLIAGSFSLPSMLERGELLRASPLYGVVLLLLLVGAAAKSAQFPFHVWLPDAMVAPTPVSAFLHSAALVAAGVYLLARFHPVFSGDPLWQWSVAGVGVASMLVGAVLALRARALKALLAYSTISQYGFVFALLGYGSGAALGAALFSFFQHGLVKAGLFLVAGAVTYATGAKEMGRAGGLWSRLPATFFLAGALALSLGGLPPFAGFWMKEGFLGATLDTGSLGMVLLGLGASALTLTYMLRFLLGAFVEGVAPPRRSLLPLPRSMVIAPAVMAFLTLLFGLWPGIAAAGLVEPAARAVLGREVDLGLSLHLDLKLLLSLLALSLGAVGFATYRRWAFLLDPLVGQAWSLDRLYAGASSILAWTGRTLLRLQNGLLPSYLYLTLLGLAGLMALAGLPVVAALPLPSLDGEALRPDRGLVDWGMALLLLLVIVGTALTFVVRRHLHVILALSAVGYLIGGVFALELAPDVGLVQVHVETLVTVLFVLALVLIPRPVRQRFALGPQARLTLGKVAVAILGGLGSAWLSWLAIEHRAADPIAPWFNENSLELTRAGDVVSAILVDFRALDTLGEITVFAIATVGVYAVVRLVRGEAE